MWEGVKQHLTKDDAFGGMKRMSLYSRTLLKQKNNVNIHSDIEGYTKPSVITEAENVRDMMVTKNESTIFVLELTVQFENNIDLNTKRKGNTYKEI